MILRIVVFILFLLTASVTEAQTNYENKWTDTIDLACINASPTKLFLSTTMKADITALQIQFSVDNLKKPVVCTLNCKVAATIKMNHSMRKSLCEDILLTENISKSNESNYKEVKKFVKKYLLKIRRTKMKDKSLFNGSGAKWEKKTGN